VVLTVVADTRPEVFVEPSEAFFGQAFCTAASPESTCYVPGYGGTYELAVSAPGYTTARRTVVVENTGGEPCTCRRPATQHIEVALAAAR